MAELNLTITIPDANVADAKAGFLAKLPNNELDENNDPKYTDKEWLEVCLSRYINKIYRKGKNIIRDREAVIISDITKP
jgi:hypothetical protein